MDFFWISPIQIIKDHKESKFYVSSYIQVIGVSEIMKSNFESKLMAHSLPPHLV